MSGTWDAGVGAGLSDVEHRDLAVQMSSTELSSHVALFYRSRTEQFSAVIPYLLDGLQNDERCLYIADDNEPELIRQRLSAAGVDVRDRTATGQLEIVTADEVYGDGGFDPDRACLALEEFAADTAENGWEGLRVAGENTWYFGVDESFDRVVEFEVAFEKRSAAIPVTALCQYDIAQFDAEAIGQALQAHEQLIYDGTLTSNPYYVPPTELLETGAPKSNVELLLEQTADVSRFRRSVERREQRLSVINRVLRHNLRNELNVIAGRLDAVADSGSDGGHVATIERSIGRLQELAERARQADRALERVGESTRGIDVVVADAVATVERESDVEVAVETTSSHGIRVDAVLEVALAAFLHAVDASSGKTDPELVVDPMTESGVVSVVVRGDEPLLSEQARRALRDDIEHPLRHCFGLRTWSARWIVDAIEGEIVVEEANGREQARILVPTVA